MTQLGLYFKWRIDKRKVHRLSLEQSAEPSTLLYPGRPEHKFIQDELEEQWLSGNTKVSSNGFISATCDHK